jgi:hypothetical protein
MTTTQYYDTLEITLLGGLNKRRGFKHRKNKHTKKVKTSPKKETSWQKPLTDFDSIKLHVSPSYFHDREQDNYIKQTKSRRKLVYELDSLENKHWLDVAKMDKIYKLRYEVQEELRRHHENVRQQYMLRKQQDLELLRQEEETEWYYSNNYMCPYDDIQSSLMDGVDKRRGFKTRKNKHTKKVKTSPKKEPSWQKPLTDFDAIKLFVSPSLFHDREQDNYIKHTKSRRRLVRELDALETAWWAVQEYYEDMWLEELEELRRRRHR